MATVVSYVARNLGAHPVPPSIPGYADMAGYPGGVVVGTDAALDSHDDDGSYVEFVGGDYGGSSAVTFQLRRAAGSPARPPGSVPLSYIAYLDVWSDDENYPALTFADGPEAAGLNIEYGNVEGPGYTAQTFEDSVANWPGPSNIAFFRAGIDQWVEPDTVWAFYSYFTHSPATTFRISYFRLDVTYEGAIPLRQIHRDDGLGGTPPRAFGGASRIRTGRAYGYD